MMSGPLTRALLALVAVAIMAWLAVLFRDSLLVARGKAIVFDPAATPAQLGHGVAISQAAGLLNPDRSLILGSEAAMYLREGRTVTAIRLYQRLVAQEPQFADAWYLIAARAGSFDPALAAHALAQLHKLDPLYPG